MQDEGYLYSKYAGAFSNPVKIDSCAKLRADKWKVCHPTGDTNPTPSCSLDMDIHTLQEIYNSHLSCYTYRKLENESKCFLTADPGHIKAQEVELSLANSCLEILKLKLQNKIEQHVVEPLVLDNQEQSVIYKKEPLVLDKQESRVSDKQEPDQEPGSDSKPVFHKKEQTSSWNNVLRIALIIFAVILLFLFIFYVL